MKIKVIQYKIFGECLLLIPGTLLILFGIGEINGGDISGIQHFMELAPLLILAIICWRYPRTGGFILAVLGTILSALYFVFFQSFPLSLRLLNTFLLFGIPVLAGLAFIVSDCNMKKILR
jgi:hypothetical protein